MRKKYKKIVEVATTAGRIMLESHAESYRVEDTVRRILQTSGLSNTEVITNTTGLYVTLDDSDPEIEGFTLVHRITDRSNQLNKIYRVNNISRQLTSGQITIDEAAERLEVVDDSDYTVFSKDIATVILVIAFVVLLGGSFWDSVFSIFTGLLVAYSRILKDLFQLNSFIYGVASTLLTAFLTNVIAAVVPLDISTDVIIIAGLMPLYPGTAVTNGLRDMLKGDYISGVARVADAIVIALSLAIGVAIGLYFYGEVTSWLV
ncbi:threonine/serine exporter ThrE family protein [Ruoffia sp. FAM 24228]|uniref:threonine/serine ThrE exporter family protein n=1 Tax=unclassified Ruoffia TaxID=2862149 RepID=UPI0038843C5A